MSVCVLLYVRVSVRVYNNPRLYLFPRPGSDRFLTKLAWQNSCMGMDTDMDSDMSTDNFLCLNFRIIVGNISIVNVYFSPDKSRDNFQRYFNHRKTFIALYPKLAFKGTIFRSSFLPLKATCTALHMCLESSSM
jgi:hypothetical protein